MREKIKVNFVDLEVSAALEQYALEKFLKNKEMLNDVVSGVITLQSEKSNRGTSQDFRIEANFKMPKTIIHIDEIGEDMYAIIDIASDKFFRRVKRYSDKQNQWEGITPWKVIEERAERLYYEEDATNLEDYVDYVPKVTVRHQLEDLTPLEEGEAIERMELLGLKQYLFRNKDGIFCMVYKRDKGGYGIVEPSGSAV